MNRMAVTPEINSGSVADMAFLLLTFFMITTQISNEKGLSLVLPRSADVPAAPVNKRNIFTIHINSANVYMIKGEVRTHLHPHRGGFAHHELC